MIYEFRSEYTTSQCSMKQNKTILKLVHEVPSSTTYHATHENVVPKSIPIIGSKSAILFVGAIIICYMIEIMRAMTLKQNRGGGKKKK